MKTINLLLASSDPRSSNLVQAAVLDACYNQAAVETIRTSHLDELVSLGRRDGIDLIVVTPGKLQPAAKSPVSGVTKDEMAQAIAALKRYSLRPLLAVDVRPQDELVFRQAGADAVFCFPFDSGALKARVRRILKLTGNPGQAPVEKPSLSGLLLRGLRLLKSV